MVCPWGTSGHHHPWPPGPPITTSPSSHAPPPIQARAPSVALSHSTPAQHPPHTTPDTYRPQGNTPEISNHIHMHHTSAHTYRTSKSKHKTPPPTRYHPPPAAPRIADSVHKNRTTAVFTGMTLRRDNTDEQRRATADPWDSTRDDRDEI